MPTDGPVPQSTSESAPTSAPTLGWRVYATPAMLVLAALGFSSGVPNLFATSIARTWTASVGWDVVAIGWLSFLQLPYALKFLWAPAVDRVRLPLLARLGQRRSWLVATHLACLAAIALACAIGPGKGADDPEGAARFMVLLAAVVTASATLDVVASAFLAESLEPRALGAGAGVFVSGYRIAFAGLGLAILWFAKDLGWGLVAGAGCSLAAVGLVASLAAREPARASPPEPGLRAAIVEPAAGFVRAWGPRLAALVAFVLLFRLPDQLGNAMTEPLLVQGLGYSARDLAWVRQGLGFGLTIGGAILGGWMVARLGLTACLWTFGALQAASNAGFLLLASGFGATVSSPAAAPAPLVPLAAAIAVESIAGGMVSAGFVAYLMSICDRRMVATQYAFLTALMAAGGAVAGGFSGILAKQLDYPAYFAMTVAAGVPGIALIAFLKRDPARSEVVSAPRP